MGPSPYAKQAACWLPGTQPARGRGLEEVLIHRLGDLVRHVDDGGAGGSAADDDVGGLGLEGLAADIGGLLLHRVDPAMRPKMRHSAMLPPPLCW